MSPEELYEHCRDAEAEDFPIIVAVEGQQSEVNLQNVYFDWDRDRLVLDLDGSYRIGKE